MTITTAPWMIATNPKVATIPKITRIPISRICWSRRWMSPSSPITRASPWSNWSRWAFPAALPAADRQGADGGGLYRRKQTLHPAVRQGAGRRSRSGGPRNGALFLDDRVRRIATVVGTIPPERRLKVYYLRGPQAVNTQGIGSATYWFGELGGASMAVNVSPGRQWHHLPRGRRPLEPGRDSRRASISHGPGSEGRALGRHQRRCATAVSIRRRKAPFTGRGLESVLFMEFVAWRLYPSASPISIWWRSSRTFTGASTLPLNDSEAGCCWRAFPRRQPTQCHEQLR